MPEILSAIACNLDAGILSAALPLLEEERVAALEWSFDVLFKKQDVPAWFDELLAVYGNERRLVGHGVFFSLFSGKWLPEQQKWLEHLRMLCNKYQFDHITEHFGFMTGADFHKGAPLSIPYNTTTMAIGRDRLSRIQDACQCPVGLENLAFAHTVEEVRQHGQFLQELIEPINGFIILDLHNLYCQLHNFSLDFSELIQFYPLNRVREIHISGGSWDISAFDNEKKIRRDTHDNCVPEEVFQLLRSAIPLCPQLKYVVLEQLGTALETVESRKAFYDDFLKMDKIVSTVNQQFPVGKTNNFMPGQPSVLGSIIEDEYLYIQQRELSRILESAINYEEALSLLRKSSLAGTEWKIESWQPDMTETARRIAQKWQSGW